MNYSKDFKEAAFQIFIDEEFRGSVLSNKEMAFSKYTLTDDEKNKLVKLVQEKDSVVKIGEILEAQNGAGWANID